MGPSLFDIWYLIIGFLLGNGVPHFVFGRAGKIFRSPFGQRSEPKTNVYWGLANFILASLIGVVLAWWGLADSFSIVVLLLGFWLTVLMFGLRIRAFLND